MTVDLIARLEAAERGSRELDCDILTYLGFEPAGTLYGWHWSNGKTFIKPKDSNVSRSLDAIAALTAEKLPGRGYIITYGKIAPDEPLGAVGIFNDLAGSELVAREEAATPALAFCIALLRALERIER